MRVIPRLFAALALVALPWAANSQVYPTTTPVYTPAAVLPATTLSAAGTVVYQANSIGTLLMRITGTGTGIAGTVQIATERSGTPNWTDVAVASVGGVGGVQKAIIATGLYRVNVAGAAQVRFSLTAITGSVAVSFSGGTSNAIIEQTPIRRQTYSAIITGLSPAASATDFLTLAGSATKTVRLQRAACSGVSTAAATQAVQGLVRSTVDTAGTKTNPAGVPHDSNSPAATAVVAAYTANPTLGSIVGSGVRVANLVTASPASSLVTAPEMVMTFGTRQDEELTLRGAAQQFVLNANGASFAAGSSLSCTVQWTEE